MLHVLHVDNVHMYMYMYRHDCIILYIHVHVHLLDTRVLMNGHLDSLFILQQTSRSSIGHVEAVAAINWLSTDMGPHTARYAVPTPGTRMGGTLTAARLLREEKPGTKHSYDGATFFLQALGVWMLNVYSHSSSGKTSKYPVAGAV